MRVNKPNKIITHTAVSAKHHTVADVDLWHKARWPGFTSRAGYHVGYHFVIDWDGTITQTRELDEEGAHCIGQNLSSVGVCFMGNGDLHMPSQEQEEAWLRVYDMIGGELPVFPHRKYANKTCHGKLLSDEYFGRIVQARTKAQLIEKLQQLISYLQVLLTQRRMK